MDIKLETISEILENNYVQL